MKNYKFKIAYIAFVVMFTILSCTQDDNSSLNNSVRSTVSSGVILRTAVVVSPAFDFFDLNSKWAITSEVQDNGNPVAEIRLYTKFNLTGVEKLFKTYTPSNFFDGSNGYPRFNISVSLAETLAKLNLVAGSYTPADQFIMRLEVLTVDGRIFSNNNASTTLSQTYFNSPFTYGAQFNCPYSDVSFISGNYKVVLDQWADYGVGELIPVSYVPADGLYKFRINNTNNIYITNPLSYYIVTVDPLNNKATVALSQPLLYSATPTDAKGTGTIGSCTGDINLKISYNVGFSGSDQVLKLVKQ